MLKGHNEDEGPTKMKRKTSAKAARQNQKKKVKIWTTPAVLGLLLSAVGAFGVIELRPQLSVSPGEMLAGNQPFSAPFEVTNSGYLGVHVGNITVIEHRIEQPGVLVTDGSVNDRAWDNFDLDRGVSKTIILYFSNGMPTKADSRVEDRGRRNSSVSQSSTRARGYRSATGKGAGSAVHRGENATALQHTTRLPYTFIVVLISACRMSFCCTAIGVPTESNHER